MILNSPYITGSITVTGNTTIQGSLIVTGSLSGTASLASNSNLLQGTGSVGFATTASLLEVSSSQQQISSSQQQISSSLLTLTASYAALSSSYISLSASYNTFSGSASTRTTQIEQTYATTGSNSFRANQSITGSLVVSSTITAQTLVVQTVTSSILYSSGSNNFGNQLSNNQTFTGSVNITGSTHAIFGNVGIGINTPSASFHVYKNSSSNINAILQNDFINQGNLIQFIQNTAGVINNAYIGHGGDSTGNLVFFNGGVQRVSISMTGTSSFTANALNTAADAATINLKQNSTTANTGIYLERSGEQKGYYIYMGGSVDSLTFQRNNAGTKADVMSLTRDGNVGIGIASPATFLHVLGSNTSARGQLSIQSNNDSNAAKATWYYNNFNSGEIGTTSSDFYALATNNFLFYAGGSERMRINSTGTAQFTSDDGSGNRTTLNDVLTITQTNGNAPYNGFGSGILFKGTTYNGGGAGIPATRSWGRIAMQITDSSFGNTGENMLFQVAALDNSDALTTALTLAYNSAATFASSVTVGGSISATIGTLSTTYNGGSVGQLHITSNGTEGGTITFEKTSGTAQKYKLGLGTTSLFIYNETAGNQPFTLTSDGNIAIGTFATAGDKYFGYSHTNGGWGAGASGLRFESVAVGGNYSQNIYIRTHYYNADSRNAIYCRYDGNVYNFSNSTAWQTTSDIRIKENIRPINNALDKINALNPSHFEYKNKLGQTKTGFVAQEFEQIFPGHVSEGLPNEDYKEYFKEGEMMKSIDADLIPYLVKAIQELKAELDTAKAEITELKNK